MSIADQMAQDAGMAPLNAQQAPTNVSANPYAAQDAAAEQRYGLPPGTLSAISQIESNNNPKAINRNKNGTVDTGRFQVNSTNPTVNGNDPDQVAQFVSNIYQKNGGSLPLTAAQYHGGQGVDPTSAESKRYVNNFQQAYGQTALGGPTPKPTVLPAYSATAPLSGLALQMQQDSQPAPSGMQGATAKNTNVSSGAAAPISLDNVDPSGALRGVGEFATQAATAGVGAVVGGYRGLADLVTGKGVDQAANDIRSTQNAVTYQPTSRQGQALSQGVGNIMSGVKSAAGSAGSTIGGLIGGDKGAMQGQAIGEIVPDVALALSPGLGLAGRGATAAGLAERGAAGGSTLADIGQAADASTSANAAAAAAKPRLKLNTDGSVTPVANNGAAPAGGAPPVANTGAAPVNTPSPIMQQIEQAKQTLAANKPGLSPDELQRHAEAGSVGVQLTRGQASGEPNLISDEMNARSSHPDLANAYNAQNGALLDSLNNLRANVAPDVTAQGSGIGQQLVDSYKTQDAQARAAISDNYQKLADANGGELPLNGDQFVSSAQAALKKDNVQRFLPTPVQGILNDLKDSGNMTFNDFENYRTILAQQGRLADRAGDGTASHAINVVTNALTDTPMDGAAAGLKQLADTARASAKQRFQAIAADPAYKAVVGDDTAIGQASPLADKFVQNYIVNGKTANVSNMLNNIGSDPTAVQAMRAGVVDNLKAASGIDLRTNTGNISQSGLNKGIQNLGNKSQLILGDDADTVNTIGNVARYTQQQPRGSFVNNSNTAAAMMRNGAQSLAEGAINVKTGGLYTPLKNMVTGSMKNKAMSRAANPVTFKDLGM